MQKKIEQFAKQHLDKLLHFLVGAILSMLMIFSWKFIFLVVVMAVLKEIVDKYIRKTGFDWFDIVATCTGAIPMISVLLFDKYVMQWI